MAKETLFTGIAVCIAIAIVIYFFFFMNPKHPAETQQTNIPNQAQTSSQQQAQTFSVPVGNPNSVVIQEVKVGTGPTAVAGDEVSVNYVGKLQDGTVFDQSSNHGGPFDFTLGAGQVIPGWEQGIQGMKVGGERILVIPPSLGYGAQQMGPIPPNSELIFDVTLVGVSTSTQPVGAEGPAAD